MKRHLTWLCAGFLVVLLACGSEDSGAAIGQPCRLSDDCESGACGEYTSPALVCTSKCTQVGAPCDDGMDYVCREDMTCGRPCDESDSRVGQVCRDGVLKQCVEVDATACNECGCDAYGGGVCDPGKGCVQPAELGESCTAHQFCASGTCDPESSKCITRRAMGETCTRDAQCESDNCSNDGDIKVEGKCNQKLGTVCSPDSDTCTYCAVGSLGGYRCDRMYCNSETAPNCGDGWACAGARPEGGQACLQECDGETSFFCFFNAVCQGLWCF